MELIPKRFKESEITNEINIIYNYILNHFKDFKYDNRQDFKVWLRFGMRTISGLKILRKFIEDTDLKIFIKYDMGQLKGYYQTQNKSIMIHTTLSDFKEYSDKFDYDNTDKYTYDGILDSKMFSYILKILQGIAKSTILHEITHAWDDYISSGKYDKNYIEYSVDEDKYMSQNIEVNARYTQTITYLESMRYYISFDEYKQSFIDNFVGWKLLDSNQQKRLLQRLIKDYNMPLKPTKQNLIMNQYSLSYMGLHFQEDHDEKVSSYQDLNKKFRISISEQDVKKYIKQSFEQMIHGNYDRKDIKNYNISQNRYACLKVFIYFDYRTLPSMESKFENGKVPDFIQKQINKKRSQIDLFKRMFNISDNDFQKFISVCESLGW